MAIGAPPPPGWYPDQAGVPRWWDGTSWTEHSAPVAAPAFDQRNAPPVAGPRRPRSDEIPTVEGLRMPKVHAKAREALRQHLAADEVIHAVVVGAGDQALFGSERRAFIFKKGFLAGATFGAEMTSWDYRSIAGIQLHTGMMTGAVIIQAPGQSGHSTSYWGNGNNDPYKAPNAIPVVRPFPPIAAVVAVIGRLIDRAKEPASGTSLQPADLAAQLRSLADLHAAGALSDQEFASAKARLLGGL